MLIMHQSLPTSSSEIEDQSASAVQIWMITTLCNALMFMIDVWPALIMSIASLLTMLLNMKRMQDYSETSTMSIPITGLIGLVWLCLTLLLLH